MALFPTSPVNNQTANVNGITYQYNTANTAWTRLPQAITSNVINATDNTTSTSLYPVMVGAAGSAQVANVTTSKLSFNASTGAFSANGTVSAGNVVYTNVDGTAGQVLTTYGNGQTYFANAASGGSMANLFVYLRSGGYVSISVSYGILDVVGRTGIIQVQLSP